MHHYNSSSHSMNEEEFNGLCDIRHSNLEQTR